MRIKPLTVCRTLSRSSTGSVLPKYDQNRHFGKFMISSGRSNPGKDMREGQLSSALSSLAFGQKGHRRSSSWSGRESASELEELEGGGGVGRKWSSVSQEKALGDPVVVIDEVFGGIGGSINSKLIAFSCVFPNGWVYNREKKILFTYCKYLALFT